MLYYTFSHIYYSLIKFMTMEVEDSKSRYRDRKGNDSTVITGVIMITLGILFLVDRYFPEIDFGDLWPFILIVVGVLIIVRGRNSR